MISKDIVQAYNDNQTKAEKISFAKDMPLPDKFIYKYSKYIEESQPTGYSSVSWNKYTVLITTSTDKKIYLPNQWFFLAAIASNYISVLEEYKNDFKETFKDETNLKEVAEELKKIPGSIESIPEIYAKQIQRYYAGHDTELTWFIKFITDYGSWGGGKTVDRGDYYVSPILKLSNLLAETQSGVAEIAKHFHDEPSLRTELLDITENVISTSKQLDINSFIDSLELNIKKNTVYRFISSLCTKPFVILTGLSGSGKTKIAQAFSSWITQEYKQYSFKVGDKIQAARSAYLINDIDRLGILVTQGGSNTKTLLPHEVISKWIKVINTENYTEEVPSQTIQNKVLEVETEYSPGLHSFHSPLKALAFEQIKNTGNMMRTYQTCLVPVGADWTNREPLLGFANALEPGRYVKPDNGVLDLLIAADKPENANLPFFLILDEMNLSHVERYFADFLSAMESGEPIKLHPEGDEWKNEGGSWKDGVPDKVYLPSNLFIIGTVNIDETTYMFSPKVLDRANVIDFSVSKDEMKEFLQNPVKPDLRALNGAGASMAGSFVQLSREKIAKFKSQDKINDSLLRFFNELKKTGAEFGYRPASEIFRFAGILKQLTEKNTTSWSTDDIIDAAVMQKLLPKVHGSRSKLDPVLKTLAGLCLANKEEADSTINKPEEIIYSDRKKIRFPLSLEKIMRMRKRVDQDGFTSFAEA